MLVVYNQPKEKTQATANELLKEVNTRRPKRVKCYPPQNDCRAALKSQMKILGYDKHQAAEHGNENSRNDYLIKSLKRDHAYSLKYFSAIITVPFTDAKISTWSEIHLSLPPQKNYKEVTPDLKSIYQSVTEDEAKREFDRFSSKQDDKYPQIGRSQRVNWEDLNTIFSQPSDIRKVIYTTNAIESLNSVIGKSVKTIKVFPSDYAAFKVVYLAIQVDYRKWTMTRFGITYLQLPE